MNKEETIDKLLCFMKNALEENGCRINEMSFNFALSYTEKYFNSEPTVIPEGEDLTQFKKLYSISDEDFQKAINCCITHNLIKYRGIGERNFEGVFLTDKGFTRADCVEKEKNFKPAHSEYVFNAPVNANNLQIGNNNNQNIENAISQIINEIDNMNAPKEQKTEAKSLLKRFLDSPIISKIVSGAILKKLGF